MDNMEISTKCVEERIHWKGRGLIERQGYYPHQSGAILNPAKNKKISIH